MPDPTAWRLFTGDDYQLVADAIYREEDRRELFRKLNGIDAPVDDQLDRLGDLAQRIAVYMRQTDQASAQSVSSQISPADQAAIGACLRAAAHGPFFDDEEFHTLFGLERGEVAAIVAQWPFVNFADEEVDRAVHNSLGQLLGYPHGLEREWPEWIPVAPTSVDTVFERWRQRGPSNAATPFMYTVWFRDRSLAPEDQDYEWPACFVMIAEASTEALDWGDHLAKRYCQTHPECEFLRSMLSEVVRLNCPVRLQSPPGRKCPMRCWDGNRRPNKRLQWTSPRPCFQQSAGFSACGLATEAVTLAFLTEGGHK